MKELAEYCMNLREARARPMGRPRGRRNGSAAGRAAVAPAGRD